ncbi:HAMP domain-containing histidine kinase [Vibrio tritonius]|uniref:histidine kinase n=1 Tax=Vibrio tritonius TaxID=1435069 RepID=A0ABS7YL18_9VIBR|nr:ATP-binding protein [Vibrio tritonius]MCA2016376.1 HAMP domain-containing histidine kinase [Vibrio tritonius]
MINFLLISTQEDLQPLAHFQPHKEVKLAKIKKWIRDNAYGLVLIDFATCGYKMTSDIIRYTRTMLRNPRIGLWLVCDQSDEFEVDDDTLWPDRIVRINEISHPSFSAAIQNELNRQFSSQQLLQEQQLNVALISKVNQFNRRDLVVQASLTEFVESLDVFCQSTQTYVVKPTKNQDEPKVYSLTESKEKLAIIPNPPALKAMLDKIQNSDLPNIVFPDETQNQTALVFPIMIFGERFCTVICLVDSNHADHLSVSRVKIIEEAASQLRISLESLEAQRRMKFHYSRLKTTLSELQKTKEHLVHSEKMASVGRLAAGIAHEINNPLSIALGNFTPLNHYVDSMLSLIKMHDDIIGSLNQPDALPDTGKLSQFKQDNDVQFICDDLSAVIEDSKASLVRVKNIVADLSSFTTQNSDDLASFSLFDACQDVIKLYHYSNGHKLKIDNFVPKDIQLTSERNQVSQAINHVVENAIEALAERDDGHIEINATQDTQGLHLTIHDNGPGIPQDTLKHVFDPFYSTKGLKEGRGLGLSVTYHLLEKLNAKISIKSEVNMGTTVTLVFTDNATHHNQK